MKADIQEMDAMDVIRALNGEQEEEELEEEGTKDCGPVIIEPSPVQKRMIAKLLNGSTHTKNVWPVKYSHLSVVWKDYYGTKMESVLVLLHSGSFFKNHGGDVNVKLIQNGAGNRSSFEIVSDIPRISVNPEYIFQKLARNKFGTPIETAR